MSPTMFMGRVVLPAVGLAVAASLAWNSVKKFAAEAEPVGAAQTREAASPAARTDHC